MQVVKYRCNGGTFKLNIDQRMVLPVQFDAIVFGIKRRDVSWIAYM